MDIIFIDEIENLDKEKLISLLKDVYRSGYEAGKKEGYYDGYTANWYRGYWSGPYFTTTKPNDISVTPTITCGPIPDASETKMESYTTTSTDGGGIYDHKLGKVVPWSEVIKSNTTPLTDSITNIVKNINEGEDK